MAILAILNTVMMAGILVGVWVGVFKPILDFRTVLQEVKKFIGKVVKDE